MAWSDRWARWIAVGALVSAGWGLGIWTAGGAQYGNQITRFDDLECRRLVIVDANDRPRLVLEAKDDLSGIWIYGGKYGISCGLRESKGNGALFVRSSDSQYSITPRGASQTSLK